MAILKWRTRGSILIAERDPDTGMPLAFSDAGCADQASIGLEVETGTHIEKCSGQDLEDFVFTKSKRGTLTLDLTEFTIENLLMALNGTRVLAGGAPIVVVNELQDVRDIEVGQYVQLGADDPHQNITALSVDGGSPPGALVVDVDYTLYPLTGLIKFLTAQAGPLSFDYTHDDNETLAMLNAGTLERWVKFNGINVAQANKMEMVDLFRVNFPPTTAFDLLPDDLGHLQLAGKILADPFKTVDGPLGQFGSITRAAA